MNVDDNVKTWIKDQIIDHAYLDVTEVEDTDHLVDNINMDSLDKAEIFINIAREYDIQIADEEADECKTVQDIYNLLETK